MGEESEPKTPGRTSACRSCQAEIVWTITKNGKQMPCDLQASAEGGFYLFRLADKIEAVHVDGGDPRVARAQKRGDKRYASHFQSCPNAKHHRKETARG